VKQPKKRSVERFPGPSLKEEERRALATMRAGRKRLSIRRWRRDPLRTQVPHASLEQGRRRGAPEDQLAIHDRGCPPSFPIPPMHCAWAEKLKQTQHGQSGHGSACDIAQGEGRNHDGTWQCRGLGV